MTRHSPSWRVVAVSPFVELPFMVLLTWSWAQLVGVSDAGVLPVVLAGIGLRYVFTSAVLRQLSRPLDALREVGTDEQLHRADEALQAFPTRGCLAIGISWGLLYPGLLGWLWVTRPLLVGPAELLTVALVGVSAGGASAAFSYLFFNVWFEGERGELSRALGTRGLRSRAPRALVGLRLGMLIVAICLAPTGLFAAMARASLTQLDRHDSAAALVAELEAQLTRVEAGQPLTRGQLLDAQAVAALPVAAPFRGPSSSRELSLDRREQRLRVLAAVETPEAGRGETWLLIEGPVTRTDELFALQLSVFIVTLMVFVTGAGLMAARTLFSPLRTLDRAVRRLVEQGDVLDIPQLPVLQNDEFGALTLSFNALVAGLAELADVAHAVSKRDLSIEIEQRGDLPEALRGMLAHLRELVEQIRMTSAEVVSGAAEIAAATQEQERAAVVHAESVAEINERVGFLANSARDINERADGVRANADGGAATAEEMAARTQELRTQTAGVSEVLELIREIADRSDLLALNGSLEATRAGEAGRGFALVAAEMRRLAERVTHSVVEVRARIAAIESASAASVSASASSREFASDTAAVAREISTLTNTQDQDTQRVSARLSNMAGYVSSASAATSQTRAAAQGLIERVEQLDAVTRGFELGESQK